MVCIDRKRSTPDLQNEFRSTYLDRTETCLFEQWQFGKFPSPSPVIDSNMQQQFNQAVSILECNALFWLRLVDSHLVSKPHHKTTENSIGQNMCMMYFWLTLMLVLNLHKNNKNSFGHVWPSCWVWKGIRGGPPYVWIFSDLFCNLFEV